VEDSGQRLGGIQIVIEGVLERSSGSLGARSKSSAFAGRKLFHGQPVTEVAEALERLLRLVQTVKGESERLEERDLAPKIADWPCHTRRRRRGRRRESPRGRSSRAFRSL